MEERPVPKPRSSLLSRSSSLVKPVAAPRTTLSSSSTASSSISSSPSPTEQQPNMSSSSSGSSSGSKHLKQELSEKGRAVISTTKRSVKNLLNRRLTSVGPEDNNGERIKESHRQASDENVRCVSMPVNNIFSGIQFYSPLEGNLRSVKNEVDLYGAARYSPPPPIYPPPPLPDETIYDELQSVASGHSGSTLSTHSSSLRNSIAESSQLQIDSDEQTCSLSDGEQSRRMSRSDSWTFYDSARSTNADIVEEEEAEIKETISGVDRCSLVSSCISQLSLQNSLYENWLTDKRDEGDKRSNCKSVLFEFDPYTNAAENVYSNYENNDMMLLETLLAGSDSPLSVGSEDNDMENELDEEDIAQVVQAKTGSKPPSPPKRFDSLPKHEYDIAEFVESPADLLPSSKNPPLLPKLADLPKKKRPAVPPRKPDIASSIANATSSNSNSTEETHSPSHSNSADSCADYSETLAKSDKCPVEQQHRKSVIQRLRKLKSDTSAHTIHNIKTNTVFNLVKNKGKLLARNREICTFKMERPRCKMQQNPASHRGVVYKSGTGIERNKELVQRFAVLLDQKLSFYSDKTMGTLKEVVRLDDVKSIHLLQDIKNVDGETVNCIALSSEGRNAVYVFYAKGVTERRIWAQRILESITTVFPVKHTSELTRVGWAYLKEGITGTWFPAWLLLQHRTLIYTKTLEPASFESLDLRKARCIVLRDLEGPGLKDAGLVPIVVVDTGGNSALHIASPGAKEGPAWVISLHQAATNCGPSLDQQQLTQDNVPVILEKCINFIYAQGIMSEGIYRRSGSSSAVVRLLEEFRKDAWATQITKSSYSEHDVATALRRFLRDLPDPLIPTKVHKQLVKASELEVENEKVAVYGDFLKSLEPVQSATFRKILAHLHCLSKQSNKNLMSVENISAVWGPTLMHAGDFNAEEWNAAETKIIADLIRFYPLLYQLSPEDLSREAKMLEVLEKHHAANSNLPAAPSGDLKIWIYIMSKDGECVNVTIGAQKTAFDVCRELAGKTKYAPHELSLEECTLSGALERPLHHNERVLHTVARWGYWDIEDRKDNVLIIKRDRIYRDIVPLIKPPMTTAGELKFADTKTKNFKSYLFEFSQSKLYCYKDKVCSVKLHEWKIEDIVWYLGHESKRNPQMGWSITFISRNTNPKRTKEAPYFGNTLAGTSKDEQYKWLAAMLFGEHQLNLRPSPVNLMDP